LSQGKIDAITEELESRRNSLKIKSEPLDNKKDMTIDSVIDSV